MAAGQPLDAGRELLEAFERAPDEVTRLWGWRKLD
jgi:hypothetical protein